MNLVYGENCDAEKVQFVYKAVKKQFDKTQLSHESRAEVSNDGEARAL